MSTHEPLPASRRGQAARYSDQPPAHAGRDVTLIDLLDRLLAGGVVLSGEITLAAADIDLVAVDLRALISSVPVGKR